MLKIKLKTVYKRLNIDRRIKLLGHILKKQGAEWERLNFTEAAKALDVSRAQLARDCQALESAKLIEVSYGKLRLASDIIEEE